MRCATKLAAYLVFSPTRAGAGAIMIWPHRHANVSRWKVRRRKWGRTYSITVETLPSPMGRSSALAHAGHLRLSAGTGTGVISVSSFAFHRAAAAARFAAVAEASAFAGGTGGGSFDALRFSLL